MRYRKSSSSSTSSSSLLSLLSLLIIIVVILSLYYNGIFSSISNEISSIHSNDVSNNNDKRIVIMNKPYLEHTLALLRKLIKHHKLLVEFVLLNPSYL